MIVMWKEYKNRYTYALLCPSRNTKYEANIKFGAKIILDTRPLFAEISTKGN